MRSKLTREGVQKLMEELSRTAPRGESRQVYFVGGGTAVLQGWRQSTIDADLYSAEDDVFRDIQSIKERLQLNVEFARPEHFVPPLSGSDDRHVFITIIGTVSFFHYDPYSQLLSKLVRGFGRDILDAKCFISSGMVDVERFRKLVRGIADDEYARYPNLSKQAVIEAVDDFLP